MTTFPPLVSRADYDAIKKVNFSSLKWMARSARHYKHFLETPSKDTDPKKLGRAVHLAVFEPERFAASVTKWDAQTDTGTAKPRRGKDWDAFVGSHVGKEILTAGDFAKCEAIQAAVRNHGPAQKYLAGRSEVTLQWRDDDRAIDCKCRIDLEAADVGAIVELKTTFDASPMAFGRQTYSLNYHTQAAWQLDGYRNDALGEGGFKHIIIAVESLAPYVVQVYRLPTAALDLGEETFNHWLDQLAECRAREAELPPERKMDAWPGYTTDGAETDLDLPRYALPFVDDDLTALGLEIES